MNPKLEITESEWRQALEEDERQERPPGSNTAPEIAGFWHKSISFTYRKLSQMVCQGTATRFKVGLTCYWTLNRKTPCKTAPRPASRR